MITIKGFQVEYATTNCYNAPSETIILQSLDGRCVLVSLKTGEITKIPDLVSYEEPRWDSLDKNVFWHTRGRKIIKRNLQDLSTLEIHKEFTEFVDYDPVGRPGVQGLGEGDIEGNNFGLAGMRPDGRREVFLYDVTNNVKGKALVLDPDGSDQTFMDSGRAHSLDNIYATPDGNLQIGWYKTGNSRFTGIELYDKDMNFIRQLATVMGHNDVSSRGLVWFCAADAVENKNAVLLIDRVTNKRTELIQFPWSYAGHVSCCNPNFCIVSLYAPNNTLPAQIWKVSLSNPGKNELFWEDHILYDGYVSTPRACVSADGTSVAFNYYDKNKSIQVNVIPVPGSSYPINPINEPINEIYYSLDEFKVLIDGDRLTLQKR